MAFIEEYFSLLVLFSISVISFVVDMFFVIRYRKRIEFLEQQMMSLVSTPKR